MPPFQILITVVDYDRVGASEPIGQVLLGCEQKGPEGKHWSEMLQTPRRPVAQWHTLKPIKGKLYVVTVPKQFQSNHSGQFLLGVEILIRIQFPAYFSSILTLLVYRSIRT